MAGARAVTRGPADPRGTPGRARRTTAVLAEGLARAGRTVRPGIFFAPRGVDLPMSEAKKVRAAAAAKSVDLRASPDGVGLALDETTTERDLADLLTILTGKAHDLAAVESLARETKPIDFGALARRAAILEHPVFNTHHSESEMMRYLAMLQSRDLSLPTSMIPLGSCTMKLNAAAEMLPSTWPGF